MVEQITSLKGTVRRLEIPSCSLTVDDLRRLFTLLNEKVRQSTERQVSRVTLGPIIGSTHSPEQQLAEAKGQLRSGLNLVVQVQGKDGDWVGGITDAVLTDSSLPDTVTQVWFNSSAGGQAENSVELTLDFTRTGLLDLTNPSGEPTPNESSAMVRGADVTWVNGVYQELDSFFHARATRHDWLHSHYIYDFLLVLIGFPSSFAWVYRADKWLSGVAVGLNQTLLVAAYIYIIILALYAFRLVFNYARWTFPRLEGPDRRRGGPWRHRATLGGLVLGLFSAVLYDLLRLCL